MFQQWLHYAIVLIVVAIAAGVLMGGLEALLPIITLGGVAYGLFHVASSLNQSGPG
jgi:hypothetical protein